MLDLPVDKTVDNEQEGESCSILNQIVLTSGLRRPDTSDWSGLAALPLIGRSNRWQEAQARQYWHLLMTIRHNVLLFDEAF